MRQRTCNHERRRWLKSRGFTLIEVMIALAIGTLVIGMALEIFSNAFKVSRKTEAFGHIQEQGRLADAVLGRDLRAAAGFDCTDMTQLNTAGGGVPVMTPPHVGGVDDAGANSSDQISIQSASGPVTSVTADPVADNTLQLAQRRGFQDGGLVAVTDCQNVRGGINTDVFRINNGGPVPAGPGTITSATALSRRYPNGSAFPVRRTSYRVVNPAGTPTLQRRVNGGTWANLIAPVYSMQIIYGEDTDGNNVADRYVTRGTVADMDEVVAVRVQLIIGGNKPNVTNTGATPNLDANDNQEIVFDAAYNFRPSDPDLTLPGGRIGQRFTIAAALRSRLP